MVKNNIPTIPVILNKFANIKCVLLKISQGVKIVMIKKTTEVRLIKDPILAIKYCFLRFLKYDENIKAKGIKEKLRINAVIVKIVNDTKFGAHRESPGRFE